MKGLRLIRPLVLSKIDELMNESVHGQEVSCHSKHLTLAWWTTSPQCTGAPHSHPCHSLVCLSAMWGPHASCHIFISEVNKIVLTTNLCRSTCLPAAFLYACLPESVYYIIIVHEAQSVCCTLLCCLYVRIL